MPWIKAEIDEQTHKTLKHLGVDEEKTISEVAAMVLEDNINE